MKVAHCARPCQSNRMHDRGFIWVAATVWLIGCAALLCEHFQPSSPLVIGMHALFAVGTCAAICLVLFAKAHALAGTSQPELYQIVRLVSRWVYILLYALAVVRMILYLYEAGPAVRSPDDFQFYVACVVLPLWLVRAVVLAVPFRGRAPQPLQSRFDAPRTRRAYPGS